MRYLGDLANATRDEKYIAVRAPAGGERLDDGQRLSHTIVLASGGTALRKYCSRRRATGAMGAAQVQVCGSRAGTETASILSSDTLCACCVIEM